MPPPTPRTRPLGWGEPAPWFEAPTPSNPRFTFSSLGGRFVGLAFLGRCDVPLVRAFITAVAAAGLGLDDERAVRFAVVVEGADLADPGLLAAFPPQRIFHDPTGEIGRSYGAIVQAAAAGEGDGERRATLLPHWLVLDPMLRVWASGGIERPESFIATLRAVPHPNDHAGEGVSLWAPVLLVPRVLEPAFCRALIDVYRQGSPQESGFMRTEGGLTVGRRDPSFKRRSDVTIEDKALQEGLRQRIARRLVPEIGRAFQFRATRIERYIVACYDAGNSGFFRAHRDNTTQGTAHRRFAVSINLNAEDYEGGDLWFPEFGTRRYRPPTGAAVVFSCSLLHEVTPVTRGIRYATLPFLYDEAAARVREANQPFLETGTERPLTQEKEERPRPG
jgi:predicted 2-oxoglutarate/Fe(II)-dependent dioxygenase YbiX